MANARTMSAAGIRLRPVGRISIHLHRGRLYFTVVTNTSSLRVLTLTMTFLYHGDPILFGRHVVASLCPYSSPLTCGARFFAGTSLWATPRAQRPVKAEDSGCPQLLDSGCLRRRRPLQDSGTPLTLCCRTQAHSSSSSSSADLGLQSERAVRSCLLLWDRAGLGAQPPHCCRSGGSTII